MFQNLPPATRSVLIATVVVFILQILAGGSDPWLGGPAFYPFMLWPLGNVSGIAADGSLQSVGFLPWQLLTYGLLHGSFGHLFFNMLALFFFGPSLEYTWGQRRFLIFYFVCVAGAGLVQLLVVSLLMGPSAFYPTVGASGGVYGLLLGYGMLFPNHRVMLLIPPIPMKARTLVIIFGALALFLGVTGSQAGVAHFAHLGGMLFGFGLIQYWRGRWPFNGRRPPGGPWRPR
jgi:membrane associated rhomboid family serine protease